MILSLTFLKEHETLSDKFWTAAVNPQSPYLLAD